MCCCSFLLARMSANASDWQLVSPQHPVFQVSHMTVCTFRRQDPRVQFQRHGAQLVPVNTA